MYIALYFIIIFVIIYASYKNPSAAFAFMLCSFALEQWLQSKDAFFLLHGSLINISAGAIVLAALALRQLRNNGKIRNNPATTWLIFALYSYAAISILWSPVPEISSSNYMHYLPYILLTIAIAPLLINNEEDAYNIIKYLVFFGGTLTVLLLFFTDWGYRRIAFASDLVQGRANPLAIANLAGYVLFASILLNLKKENNIWRLARWLVALVCLGIAVKTGSRGQFLLMILLSIALLPLSRPITQIKSIAPLLFAGIIIIGGSYFAMQEYTSGYTKVEGARWGADRMSDDISGRFDAANNLIRAWYGSPANILFGLGSSASYDKSIAGFYTHIVPLEILGELGLIGFLAFLVVLLKTFSAFRNCVLTSKGNSMNRGVLAAITAIVLFELILSFKQGSFLSNQILFSMLIMLSRLEAAFKFTLKQSGLNTSNEAYGKPSSNSHANTRLRLR
ncbi:MAG: hypothetical protein KUG81_06775 [Gammaproteobacteria bacterium]|nr:hypothetical protein [Gammaproteobacteria bacterium]